MLVAQTQVHAAALTSACALEQQPHQRCFQRLHPVRRRSSTLQLPHSCCRHQSAYPSRRLRHRQLCRHCFAPSGEYAAPKKILPTLPPTAAPTQMPTLVPRYELRTAGDCAVYITSIAECEEAARELGLPDTSASDDHVKRSPVCQRGCYGLFTSRGMPKLKVCFSAFFYSVEYCQDCIPCDEWLLQHALHGQPPYRRQAACVCMQRHAWH